MKSGFSLVEVVLAIGVVAFAFVAIFALLPVGMGVFREAVDTSVSSQIVQRIAGDAQETDFDTLIDPTKNGGTAKGEFYVMPVRYFDDQGTEIKIAANATPTNAQRNSIVYHVRVRGSNPGNLNPASHKSNYFTSLPTTSGERFNPRDLTILTIEIVNNPSSRDLTPVVDTTTQLINPKEARKLGVRYQTYPVAIARNGKKT